MDEKYLAEWQARWRDEDVHQQIDTETGVELLRLARLGLWAEQHGVPAIEYYSLIHRSLEDQRIVSGAPAREALAALPKGTEMGNAD